MEQESDQATRGLSTQSLRTALAAGVTALCSLALIYGVNMESRGEDSYEVDYSYKQYCNFGEATVSCNCSLVNQTIHLCRAASDDQFFSEVESECTHACRFRGRYTGEFSTRNF